MESFSIKQVVEILDLPRERFKEWVYRGFVSPSVQKASGPGTANLYNRIDLYSIELLNRLVKRGFNREVAANYTKQVVAWLTPIQPEKTPEKKVIIAFINRPAGFDKIYDKKGKEQRFSDFRIITGKALNYSFSDLLVTLKDALPPSRYDTSEIDFDDIVLVNFSRIRDYVDSRIKEL